MNAVLLVRGRNHPRGKRAVALTFDPEPAGLNAASQPPRRPCPAASGSARPLTSSSSASGFSTTVAGAARVHCCSIPPIGLASFPRPVLLPVLASCCNHYGSCTSDPLFRQSLVLPASPVFCLILYIPRTSASLLPSLANGPSFFSLSFSLSSKLSLLRRLPSRRGLQGLKQSASRVLQHGKTRLSQCSADDRYKAARSDLARQGEGAWGQR